MSFASWTFGSSISNVAGSQTTDLVDVLLDGIQISGTCVTSLWPSDNQTDFSGLLSDGLIALGRIVFQVVNAERGAQAAVALSLGANGQFGPTLPSAAGALRNTRLVPDVQVLPNLRACEA